MTAIFIDTSAFIALYLKGDEFHTQATSFLTSLSKNTDFVTSNYILDEVYTFLRINRGKEKAVSFAEFLAENTEIIKLKRINLEDEKEAFLCFKKFDFSQLSFTDCTSFALMKRLELKESFTFDKNFAKAGFKMLPLG
jgi:predicted nucleic acid-binding protein